MVDITIPGYVLIPFGIIFLLKSSDLLYIAMLLSSSFSAMSVVNFSTNGHAVGLQATIYFGLLWIMKELYGSDLSSKKALISENRNALLLLLIFMIVVLISLFVPLIISGDIVLPSDIPELTEAQPIRFTFHNVTQYIYLLYGCVVCVCIMFRNANCADIKLSIKTLLISGVILSCLAIWQFLDFKFDLYYPDYIFNCSHSISARGHIQIFEKLGIKRLCAAAVEPSIYAQYLLVSLSLGVMWIVSERTLFSKNRDYLGYFIMLVMLFMSTSTTAYVGYVMFIVIVSMVTIYYRWRIITLAKIYGISFVVIGSISYMYQGLFKMVITSKIQEGSGAERLASVATAFEAFKKYPLLGVGWGSIGSHDMIVKLLSNTGILGFIAFFSFIAYIIVQCLKWMALYRDHPDETAIYLLGLFCAFIVLLCVSTLTGFPFVFGHWWIIVGLLMGINLCILQSRKRELS